MFKSFYFKFRPFLFAVALGLAGVWFYKGIMLGREYIDITLPQTESGNILFVFGQEQRFMPISGGSHFRFGIRIDDSAKPIPGKLTFILPYFSGPMESDIPDFVNIRRSQFDGSLELTPYFIECQERVGIGVVKIPQSEKKFSQHQTIQLKKDLKFTVDKPSVNGVCQLYVAISHTEPDAKALLLTNADQAENEQDFTNGVRYSRFTRFINE